MLNDIANNCLQPAVTARKAELGSSAAAQAVHVEPTQPEQKAATPDPQELQSTVSKLTDYFQNLQRTLSFSIEEDTGSIVINVYDSETEELIRQIPSKESIKLAALMEEQAASLLLEEQA